MEPIKVAGITFRLDPTKPFYEQIVEQVCGALARGELGLEQRMPSVRELAQLLKVNPNTVMRAYQDLERSGLLVTYRGQGTFTTTKIEPVERAQGFSPPGSGGYGCGITPTGLHPGAGHYTGKGG